MKKVISLAVCSLFILTSSFVFSAEHSSCEEQLRKAEERAERAEKKLAELEKKIKSQNKTSKIEKNNGSEEFLFGKTPI